MLSRCHKSCNMCHIHHKICSHFICDLTEFFEINGTCICTGACYDQLRPAFLCNTQDFLIIDHTVIIYTIVHGIEIHTGHIRRASMCQMSAVVQIHSKDSVTGL